MSDCFKKGFTLIELMTSLAVVAIVLSVVLSSQGTYTDGAAIRNAADNIAVSISQAQVYGVGVRGVTGIGFDIAYGVEFNRTSSGSNDAYISFVDKGGVANLYDSGWSCPGDSSSECLEKIFLPNGITITSMCSIASNDAETCNVGRVDVVFRRPETQATLTLFDTSGNLLNLPTAKGVKINLSSVKGADASVTFFKTGQVSVQ